GGHLDDEPTATFQRDAHDDPAPLLGDLQRTVSRPRLHGRPSFLLPRVLPGPRRSLTWTLGDRGSARPSCVAPIILPDRRLGRKPGRAAGRTVRAGGTAPPSSPSREVRVSDTVLVSASEGVATVTLNR